MEPEIRPRPCGSQASILPTAPLHKTPSYDGLWVDLVRSGQGFSELGGSTGAPQEGATGASTFPGFLFSLNSLQTLLSFPFSHPYHCMGSLWKHSFCSITVTSYVLPYQNVQGAWHRVDAPKCNFYYFEFISAYFITVYANSFHCLQYWVK